MSTLLTKSEVKYIQYRQTIKFGIVNDPLLLSDELLSCRILLCPDAFEESLDEPSGIVVVLVELSS